MAVEITMPKLSDTMEEGTILKWRVKEGTHVKQGDIIAEVETDKAAMEMEAFEAGVVKELRVPEGETVQVGTIIAVLGVNGETQEEIAEKPVASGRKAADTTTATAAREESSEPENKEGEPVEKEQTVQADKNESPQQKAEPRETTAAEPPVPEPADAGRIATREESKSASGPRPVDWFASPVARRLAQEREIDLKRVRGTGPGGRIVQADVERRVATDQSPPPIDRERRRLRPGEARKGPSGKTEKRPERSVKLRRLVARKMVESWQTIPHFFVTVAVDMTDIIRIRKDLGASINDFIVTAAARCLIDHPWVNSHWVEGEAAPQETVDICIAVATDRGLYNPVVRDCGRLSLKEIGRRTAELVEKAHAGRLTAEDLEGGTFTISNMGMLGVEAFSAIITPPQAAVLAVGTVKGEAVVDEKGEPGIAPTVRLTLSADHRILDGADAAEFLTAMKSYLEAPVILIACDQGKD